MSWFLLPELQPFTIAAAVLLALVAIEMVGTLAGTGLSDVAEMLPLESVADSALGWLNLGRVPLLILLILMLGLFSASGMVLQAIAEGSIGLLSPLVAVSCSAAFALLTTGTASKAVARILPRDESYALAEEDLVGRVGIVTVGPLESHAVGKMSVSDANGNRHFPRVRPAQEGEKIETGASVLIVDMKGHEYRVIRAPAGLEGRATAVPPASSD